MPQDVHDRRPPVRRLTPRPKPAGPLRWRTKPLKVAPKPKPKAVPKPAAPKYGNDKAGLTNRQQRLSRMSTNEQQQWLANMGYNVDVDGIEGPQTRAARQAFLKGQAAKKWNQQGVRPGGAKPPKPASGGAPPSASGPVAPTKVVVPKAKVKSVAKATVDSGALNALDPEAFAKAATDAEYNAQIAAVQRAIEANNGSLANALKDIRSWTNQIKESFGRDAAKTQTAYATAGATQGASDTAIGNLFGESNAGAVAASTDPGEDLLQQLGANAGAFSSIMQPLLSAQGMDYARRAQNSFNAQGFELGQQKLDLEREKGQSYKKNLFDYMQQQLQYQTAQQALQQASDLNPYAVKTAKQGVKQNDLQLQAQSVALQKAKVELQKLKQSGQAQGLDFTDPTTMLEVVPQIVNAVFKGAVGPKGRFIISPRAALDVAMQAAQIYGVAQHPEVQKAIFDQFSIFLRLSHAAKMWGGYFINKNGQLVYDPAKKFKKQPKK